MTLFSVPRFAREIDTLTAKDLDGVSFVRFEDPENVTSARFLKLRDLLRHRDYRIKNPGIDARELVKHLLNLEGATCTSQAGTISPPYTPEVEEMTPIAQVKAIETYCILIQEGARPPRALQLDPGPCNHYTTDEEIHPLSHFNLEAGFFLGALERWREFRKWQKTWRATPQKFAKLQNRMHGWRRERGFNEDLQLLSQAAQQTKLIEWKEYHGFQASKVKKWARKAEAAQKAVEVAEKKSGTEDPCWENYWRCRSRLSYASRQLEEAMPVLDWIEQEVPKVATETEFKPQHFATRFDFDHLRHGPPPHPRSVTPEDSIPVGRQALKRKRSTEREKGSFTESVQDEVSHTSKRRKTPLNQNSCTRGVRNKQNMTPLPEIEITPHLDNDKGIATKSREKTCKRKWHQMPEDRPLSHPSSSEGEPLLKRRRTLSSSTKQEPLAGSQVGEQPSSRSSKETGTLKAHICRTLRPRRPNRGNAPPIQVLGDVEYLYPPKHVECQPSKGSDEYSKRYIRKRQVPSELGVKSPPNAEYDTLMALLSPPKPPLSSDLAPGEHTVTATSTERSFKKLAPVRQNQDQGQFNVGSLPNSDPVSLQSPVTGEIHLKSKIFAVLQQLIGFGQNQQYLYPDRGSLPRNDVITTQGSLALTTPAEKTAPKRKRESVTDEQSITEAKSVEDNLPPKRRKMLPKGDAVPDCSKRKTKNSGRRLRSQSQAQKTSSGKALPL